MFSDLFNKDNNVQLVIRSMDIKELALVICEELRKEENAKKEMDAHTYLTRSETRKMCHVSNATLWRWAKEKYLVPIKVGSRLLYLKKDVTNLLEGKNSQI